MRAAKVLCALFTICLSATYFHSAVPPKELAMVLNASAQVSSLSCINETDLYSLIETIEYAESSFLFPIGENSIGEHVWWNALLGLNNALNARLPRRELEQTVRRLRREGFVHSTFRVYMHHDSVERNSNAHDFFRFLTFACADNLAFARNPITSSLERSLLSLNDPYTSYIEPERARQYRANEEVAGSVDDSAGIGVSLYRESNLSPFTIVSVKRGSPAFEAGINVGDKLINVDKKAVFLLSHDEVVEMLRGESGSSVSVAVEHQDDGEMEKIVLQRDYEMVSLEMLGSCTALVGITSFESRHVGEALRTKLEQAVSACEYIDLILDLRGNHGGLLLEAVEAADVLLADGNIVYTQDRAGKRVPYLATDDNDPRVGNVVVLVDNLTASSAEVLSAALTENNTAVLVGNKTYGKGVGQYRYTLSNGGIAQITTFHIYPPSNRSYHGTGLAPDVSVPSLSTEEVLGLIDGDDQVLLDRLRDDNGLRIAYQYLKAPNSRAEIANTP